MDIGEELPQFALPLDAPDGQHVLILGQPGIGGGGVVDEPAGEPLHGDEAHARLPAGLRHRDVLVRGQVAEGELKGVVAVSYTHLTLPTKA